MTGRLWFVVTGAVAIMTLAAMLLVLVPRAMLARVPPPERLEPYDGSVLYGRWVYVSEGCVYCHTQQVRDPTVASDEARGWGRASVPADYVYDLPHLLGTMRTGPDLINVAARLPDRQWHLLHLYQPRALNEWSVMPSFRYLFEVVPEDAPVTGEIVRTPPGLVDGVLVASRDASALVDYLLSLDRTWPPTPADEGIVDAR